MRFLTTAAVAVSLTTVACGGSPTGPSGPANLHVSITDSPFSGAMAVLVTRGGPRFSDRLLRWSPDPTGGIWNATQETELPG